MQISNQRYIYIPLGGDPSRPIVIIGLQEFSPGQSQKVDVWRFDVPAGVADGLHLQETDNWASVIRALRAWFPHETEESLKARITAA